jgi:hypothetical protein
MKRFFSLLLRVGMLMMAACGNSTSKPPKSIQPDLDKFMSDGLRLTSLTSQGVSLSSFGEQLATTNASFDVLHERWPSNYQPSAKKAFEEAIYGWKLLYRVWSLEVTKRYPLDESSLISALDSYAPGRIPREKDFPTLIQYGPTVRVLMSVADEHFENGRRQLLTAQK